MTPCTLRGVYLKKNIMQKMNEIRQKYVTSRMLQLRGYRYFHGISEVSKFEIAHSGIDIMKVIANKTFLRTIKIIRNGRK